MTFQRMKDTAPCSYQVRRGSFDEPLGTIEWEPYTKAYCLRLAPETKGMSAAELKQLADVAAELTQAQQTLDRYTYLNTEYGSKAAGAQN